MRDQPWLYDVSLGYRTSATVTRRRPQIFDGLMNSVTGLPNRSLIYSFIYSLVYQMIPYPNFSLLSLLIVLFFQYFLFSLILNFYVQESLCEGISTLVMTLNVS